MATLLKIVVSGLLGVVLGLLVTIASLDSRARGLAAGPWHGSPRDGTPDVDPYGLASIERSGTLPLGAAEGLRFMATTDSAGDALVPSCDYAVTGPMPAARFWSLSALTRDGFPIANPAGRFGFTSAEILRDAEAPGATANASTIVVSTEAHAGNWLPIGPAPAFVLALHLYDTGLSAAGTAFDAHAMPAIRKLRCAA